MPKFLIIDDHEDFRILAKHHITAKWRGAIVIEHDPLTMGSLGDDFDGSGYDVVLLDYNLGSENGIAYLKRFRKIKNFPPVIMLTGEGDERLAVDAIRNGAADYIPKQKMSHDVLVSAIQEALDARGSVTRYEEHDAEFVSDFGPVQIKGFKIGKKLGAGGMSNVFLAKRESGGEPLVIKVMSATANDRYQRTRFFREYEIVTRLDHKSIVKIYEQGFGADYAYIAMEYFPAGSMRELTKKGMTLDQALDCARGIAESLTVVHKAGVVHRDLKPANIMFRDDGTVVLIDFGVARATDSDLNLTRAGVPIGTPHYMSPEQAEGRIADARSDLYSLGILLYEMIIGSVPFTARTPLAILYKQKHAPIPKFPAPLEALQPVLERLLAKDPEQRFKSAAEFLDELDTATIGIES